MRCFCFQASRRQWRSQPIAWPGDIAEVTLGSKSLLDRTPGHDDLSLPGDISQPQPGRVNAVWKQGAPAGKVPGAIETSIWSRGPGVEGTGRKIAAPRATKID